MASPLQADPAALMRIKNLQWRAKRIVDGFQSGLHRSPRQGFSVEFSEYRPFVPGDDPRNIDWKLYARSDRYFLKKFEDETNRRCHLIVDQSRSMAYGSLEYSKLEYARTMAATLAYFLSMQRDAVGMMTFEADVTGIVPARFRHGQLRRLLSLLDQPPTGQATDLMKPLVHLAELIKHRGMMVIISDFLVPIESLEQPIAYLVARHHEIMLLRILDPRELNFTLPQATVLRDLESGRELYIDPSTAERVYRERFQDHADALQKLASNHGIELITTNTNQALEVVLAEMIRRHEQRTTRGRTSQPRSLTSKGAP
jgi:uncharacterized protein (DUF58 family)